MPFQIPRPLQLGTISKINLNIVYFKIQCSGEDYGCWRQASLFKFCSAYNFHFIICEISGILTRLPGGSVDKDFTCRCKKHRFDPWVRKISWRRAWKPTPVFLPGESHRQRSLAGYSPWVCKEQDTTEVIEHKHKSMLISQTGPVSLFMLLLSHFSSVRLCATPQTAAHQAPRSLGFSRQERWSGLPFPSPICTICRGANVNFGKFYLALPKNMKRSYLLNVLHSVCIQHCFKRLWLVYS